MLLKEKGLALPTIIVTAYGDVENNTVEKLRSCRVNGILSKPFDPGSLINILNELVEDPQKICC
jgi:FixJ family two-component response regulator